MVRGCNYHACTSYILAFQQIGQVMHSVEAYGVAWLIVTLFTVVYFRNEKYVILATFEDRV